MSGFDLLITGGRLIDGTGNPYYHADVGIVGGRISEIAKGLKEDSARQVLRADGLVVSPGFFDAHSHDDAYVLHRPTCDGKVLMGVTTTVIGNCGFSMGPVSERYKAENRDLMAAFGANHLSEEDWRIRTLGDYLDKLQDAKPGINVLPLVGHNTIRTAVMGSEVRDPAPQERLEMRALLREALQEGAFGLSSGLVYAPGTYCKTNELIDLAVVLREFHALYATHVRGEGATLLPAVAEAIQIGEVAGVPVHISHQKAIGQSNWGKSEQSLALIDQARDRGLEVTSDQYPYRAGSTFLAAVLPPTLLSGGPDVFAERLKDPAIRRQAIEEIENPDCQWENYLGAAGFQGTVISVSPNHPEYIGRSIADIAESEGRDPYDVIFDLIVEEKRATIMLIYVMDELDIIRILKHPTTMIGTDAFPKFGQSRVHPRFMGTFPRILGRYVRGKGVLSLEEAVRKMTSLPAQTFGLNQKGLIKEGFDADITIFDPDTIIDKADYAEPDRPPEGIRWVLVNGKIAVDQGKIMGAKSGKVLRRGARGNR